MTSKLEEFFDQEQSDNKKEIAKKEESTEVESVATETNEMLKLEHFDKEMDEIASEALQSFQEIMSRCGDVESKDAGSIYKAASDMLKNAISARNSKMDARIRSADLSVKFKREYNRNNDEEEEKNFQSRAEILKNSKNNK